MRNEKMHLCCFKLFSFSNFSAKSFLRCCVSVPGLSVASWKVRALLQRKMWKSNKAIVDQRIQDVLNDGDEGDGNPKKKGKHNT